MTLFVLVLIDLLSHMYNLRENKLPAPTTTLAMS